ncbi:GPI-linked NAD(P)(+)--arginine ADP-ribosyltransferase 1-like [Alosa sapidissima]|uniref:GPI-linked NAD(P)(+)--arginine ADP-ribosyltransferase 1-like n=1 Tax=Alosa sapidissima TaxID=34773 RepID=UPI001C09B755|nr:GPI-linked NAD(P)(+)--arginine ADP-ribosyltransferase 1-like [Alosa sapidissima]XP_041934161.1 GPI-linked NAD(P)(+)--arginine ADP-ribosyltransferase 1-like [Alosa sapidissima]
MMKSAVLVLILTTGVTFGKEEYALDMADNSVDDQYQECTEKMSRMVENTYLKDELKRSKNFSAAWSEGQQWCSSNKKGDNLGGINYCTALYVYTLLNPPIYKAFNTDTRGGKTQYTGQTYQWYSLHFLLTRAVQVLKDRERKNGTECRSVYRGTGVPFKKYVLNKEIRLGSFTSSSLKLNVTKSFGNVSCFEINTCHGANITEYSTNPDQEEVLIPPYETFKVTEVNNPGLWCKTVYKLQSTGIKSNLNCSEALTSKASLDRHIDEL